MAAAARLPPPLLLLLLGRGLAQERIHSAKELFAKNTEILERCYFVDRRYSTDTALKFVDVDYHACQRRCQNTTSCAYFGYWQETQTCWLGGADAVFTDYLAKGGIAGPKYCPDTPAACTEVPGPGFPGEDAEESKKAWPSHRVPEKLECWPKNVSGGFYDSCPHITVLEDTASGWPGLCMGTHRVLVPWGETCESYCRKKASCSVYQVMNDSAKSCFHSKLHGGSHCYMRSPDPFSRPPIEAKRIMHGRVRVLKETTGVQVIGLVQAFDENYFLNVTRDAVPACRNNCYSNIGCQWWQYSRAQGCWVEDPSRPVSWPMTTEFWRTSGYFASTVIGGEYIQHICPGKAGLPADAGAAVDGLPQQQQQQQQPVTTEPEGGAGVVQPSEGAVPAGTLAGYLVIHGLYYGSLTEAQGNLLNDDCTSAIASTVGVSKSWVKDESGVPGQVTMRSVVGGTRASFLVDKPQGMTSNDVSRALLQHSFIDNVKGTAQRLLGSSRVEVEGGGLAEPSVTVHSVVMETTPQPAMPVVPTLVPAGGTESTEDEEGAGLPNWFWMLLVPVALLLGLGGCAYLYSQSKQKERSEQHSGRKSKKSPPKARKQDSAPLLGSSPSTSEVSSQRDYYGAPVGSALSSQPPPSPIREMEDKQSTPLLGSNRDPARLKLEGAFDAQAPAGAGAATNGRASDYRASVLSAAFDIMDANGDGVLTPDEVRPYEYVQTAPALRPPSLAASLGPASRPPGPRPPVAGPQPMGLQPPSLPAPAALVAPVATVGPRPVSMPAQQAVPMQMQGGPFNFRR